MNSDEAVEAAARALKFHYDSNGEFSELTKDPFTDEARVAIKAALPHLMAQAWEEGALSAMSNTDTRLINPYGGQS